MSTKEHDGSNIYASGDISWYGPRSQRNRLAGITPDCGPIMKWQPIETAPKDGTWVLVRCALRSADEQSCPVAVARWGKGYIGSGAWGDSWRVDGNVDLGWYPDPTHWMPLPDPPQEHG